MGSATCSCLHVVVVVVGILIVGYKPHIHECMCRPPPPPSVPAGTLAPLSSFASELGVHFEVRLEAPHVIDATKQLWIGCMGVSPSGRGLLGTFKFTDVSFCKHTYLCLPSRSLIDMKILLIVHSFKGAHLVPHAIHLPSLLALGQHAIGREEHLTMHNRNNKSDINKRYSCTQLWAHSTCPHTSTTGLTSTPPGVARMISIRDSPTASW